MQVFACANRSYLKADVEDVAVLDDVLLAFETHFAARLCLVPTAARRLEILPGDNLAANEATRQVAVNLLCRPNRVRAFRDRPGAYLVLADGEETEQTERGVGCPNQPVARRLRNAQLRQKLR